MSALPVSPTSTQTALTDHHRPLARIDALFGGYCLLFVAVALLAWLQGMGGLQSLLVFVGFIGVNGLFSLLSFKAPNPARVEIGRVIAGTLSAPVVYVLAGEPFMRWWPGFLIMSLGGNILWGLLTGSPNWGRFLSVYYAGLLVVSELLIPPPHDWVALLVNAGAVAMVGLLFAEIVSMLGMTLAAEREQRRQLAAEKAKSEAMLKRESDERFRILVETSNDGIVMVNAVGQVYYANPAFERITGYTNETLKQMETFALAHPDDARLLAESFARLLHDPTQPVAFTFRIRNAAGEWRWLETVGKCLPNGDAVIYNRDVTESRIAESKLRLAELRFRAVFEQPLLGVRIYTPDGYLRDWNLATEQFHSMTPEVIAELRHTYNVLQDAAVIAGGHLPNVQRAFAGEAIMFPPVRLALGAQTHWTQHFMYPVRDETGAVYEVVSMSRDVTGQKEAEEKLRESEEYFRSLIENSSDGISVLGPDGTLSFVSPALARMLGYTPDDMVGQTFAPFIVPENLPATAEHFQNIMAHPGETLTTEIHARHKDGSTVIVENAARLHPNGKIISNSRDITERKQAEAKIRESEAYYRTLIEASTDGISIINPDGTYAFVSAWYEKMVGFSAAELLGRSFIETLAPESREYAGKIFADLLASGATPPDVEVSIQRKDGEKRVFEASARILPDGRIVSFSRDITERKQAEDKIRESETLYRTLIETSTDAFTLLSPTGHYLFTTPQFEQLSGYSATEILGQSFTSILPPDETERVYQIFLDVLRGTAPPVIELRLRRKDGVVRLIEASARLLPDGRIVSFSRDITERRHAEEKLRESETLYRTLIEASTDGIDILNPDGTFNYVSPQFQQLMGFTAEELVGRTFDVVVPPEELARVNQVFAELVVPGAEPSLVETYIRRKDGALRFIEASARVLPDGRLVTFNRDVTERKQAEEQLRKSEASFRSLIETSVVGIVILGQEGAFRYVNPAYEEILGYTAAELLDQPFAAYMHPDDVAKAMSQFGQMLQTPNLVIQSEIRARRKDGTWRILEGAAKVLPSGEIVAYNRDVTAQKEAEEQLRQLNEELEQRVEERTAESKRLAAIIEAMPDYVGIAASDGTSLYVNQAGRKLMGKSSKDETSWNVASCYPLEEIQRLQPTMFAAMQQGDSWAGEATLKHRAGHLIPADHIVFPLRNAEGQVESYAAVIRDITERKRAETELHRAKEAAETANKAKSTFLANMSHEIRTPMNAVIGMTSLLANTPLNDKQRDFVETIRTSGDALLTIINDILDFSKIEAGKLELVNRSFDLRDCIEAVLDLLSTRAAEKNLDLVYDMADDVPAALIGDVTRVRQILVNLVSNAVKFTETGEVVVNVKRIGGLENFPILQFSVRDTGLGIPPDKIGRLFQSFSQIDSSFTREYGGTGLGLAISKRLTELMGGAMWAESVGIPGQGSTFHFTLTAESAPAPIRAHLQARQPSLAGQRVLIVDDHPTNRRILTLQTQTWGMLPSEAASPSEALNRLRAGEHFDLAILDMHMPEMDGATLAAALCEEHQKQGLHFPLVVLTSLSHDSYPALEAVECFAAYLTKPVKPSQLYDVLVSVLAAEVASTAPASDMSATNAPLLAQHLPLRILLAEDVAVNQKFALLALEEVGYTADVAGNGLEVLEALKRQPYDVVLMDVQMPVLDGLEATRRIRRDWPAHQQPRIVAMTANAMQGDREMCLEAGMDDYISKPVYLDELRAVLERAGYWLKEFRQWVGAEPMPSAPMPVVREASLDRAVLDKLLARPAGRELTSLFINEGAEIVAELRAAVQQADAEAMRAAAHKLKGSSRYVGAWRLAALTAELEQEGRQGAINGVSLALLVQVEEEFANVRTALAQPV